MALFVLVAPHFAPSARVFQFPASSSLSLSRLHFEKEYERRFSTNEQKWEEFETIKALCVHSSISLQIWPLILLDSHLLEKEALRLNFASLSFGRNLHKPCAVPRAKGLKGDDDVGYEQARGSGRFALKILPLLGASGQRVRARLAFINKQAD